MQSIHSIARVCFPVAGMVVLGSGPASAGEVPGLEDPKTDPVAEPAPVEDVEPVPMEDIEPALAADSFEVQRQVAWARLYGYLRWFHPSDELSAIDPEQLACLGAQRARDADDPEALAAALSELIAPLAPTVRIWVDGQEPTAPVVVETSEGRQPIAWMHSGVGLSWAGSTYTSVRAGRVRKMSVFGDSFGNLTQSVPAAEFAGLPFRYQAQLRSVRGEVQLWFRTDGGETQFFDNMEDRPIRSSDWETYGIEGEIPVGAERLVFGAFVDGFGSGQVDDLRLEIERDGAWVEIPLENPGFERSTKGWSVGSKGFSYTQVPHDGGSALQIERKMTGVKPPFERVPEVGSTTAAAIGAGLRVDVPLVLLSEDDETLPGGDVAVWTEALADVPCSEAKDLETRVAAVAISWNIHQHFHPYLDVVGTDWLEALSEAMYGAIEAEDAGTFRDVLRRMTAKLSDGHVYVRGGPMPDGFLSLRLELLDGQVVVMASAVEGIAPGDVVLSADGVPALELHAATVPLVSGSPQVVALDALRGITAGEKGDTTTLEVVGGDGEPREVEATFGQWWSPPPEHEPIRTLEDGVMVVDLTRAEWGALRMELKALAKAPGVVVDVRGYPTSYAFRLLEFLITEPEDRDWMFVAEQTHPDQAGPIEWPGYSWKLRPRRPHVDNTVWITDARAGSYAESVLGHISDLEIGPIVGRHTAGANGNVNPYQVPGGYTISWTGMKVLTREGGQHHIIGVPPTHPVEPTVEGLRAGRDEPLEKALELVRAGVSTDD